MPPKPPAIVNLKLRIRESLRRKIEVAAKKNDTSLNAEFVKRVEASFQTKQPSNSVPSLQMRMRPLARSTRMPAESSTRSTICFVRQSHS